MGNPPRSSRQLEGRKDNMDSTRPIARFWTRSDGATCLLYKGEAGWCLTVEKAGQPIKTHSVPSPTEAINLAKLWRREQDTA